MIGVPWQGRGYSSESAAAAVDWLRGDGVGEICAHIHPADAASNGVARRMGMVSTSRRDDDGEMIWTSPAPEGMGPTVTR